MTVSVYGSSLRFWYDPIVQTDLIPCLTSVGRVTFFLARFPPCLTRTFSSSSLPELQLLESGHGSPAGMLPAGSPAVWGVLFLGVSDIASSASSCTGAHALHTLLPLVFWHRPFGVWCSGGCLAFLQAFSRGCCFVI